MTRKKFCKALMGIGYGRNQAAAVAARCMEVGVPYKTAFAVLTHKDAVRRACAAICEVLAGFSEKIREAAKAAADLAEAVRSIGQKESAGHE